jgi:hypothetical protein
LGVHFKETTMRKVQLLSLASLIAILSLAIPAAVQAHQPVTLLTSDTTAAKGPLLVDGTVSFAIRASFTKSGESRGFRAGFKAGDALAVQFLIADKSPENKLKTSQMPTLVITSPTGVRTTLKLNERSKFFEPYSQTKYLYLGRLNRAAEDGIYSFTLTSRAKSAVTIAVGEREVIGEVLRAAKVLPAPTVTPSVSPSPTPSPTLTTQTSVGFTQPQVEANNSTAKCWSIINDNVYDLTKWIKSHPGGQSAITFICGKDGTDAFLAQHRGQSSPFSRLASFYIGPFIG